MERIEDTTIITETKRETMMKETVEQNKKEKDNLYNRILEDQVKHLEKTVDTLQGQLLDMRYKIDEIKMEENDSTTTDETTKSVLKESISNA